jgi:hypothetical protein
MQKAYIFLLVLLFSALGSFSQQITIDISGSVAMVHLLKDIKTDKPQTIIETRLDSVLNTRPYQFMFQHYNRSWRPNTLPKDVFKRMIISLKWPDAYKLGENKVADYMKDLWTIFFTELDIYEKRVAQLSDPKLNTYIQHGVNHAQKWLPSNMKVPDFYLAILPVGRSNAFVFNGSQGYDLLQLPIDIKGNLNFTELISTIAHESHHLGLKLPSITNGSLKDSLLHDYLKIFLPEGSATKFIDNFPGGNTPIVDKTKGFAMDNEVDSLWKAYTVSEKEFFNAMIIQFEGIASGYINRDSFNKLLGDYWLNGAAKPPLYFWGSELVGIIYWGLGKKAVFDVMNDPKKLFFYYNKALKKKPSLRSHFSLISERLVVISMNIGNTPGTNSPL